MANNRMYLVHKPTGTSILLSKYYPNTGWYIFHDRESYDSFFDILKDGSLFGDDGFELRYETSEEQTAKVLEGTENFSLTK